MDLKSIDLKRIDFKNIYEWPLYGRMLVFALVCMGVFYFGYFFDFSEQSGQIYSRYRQELDLKEQVGAILKTKQEMQEVVLQFPEVRRLLNQWQGQLIDGGHLPDLLNQILKLGAANHLQFSLFAPGTKKREDNYDKVSIKVVVQGGYSQVARFISDLANLPQLISVSDFIMVKQAQSATEKPAGEGPTATNLTTAMTLEVYYLANKK